MSNEATAKRELGNERRGRKQRRRRESKAKRRHTPRPTNGNVASGARAIGKEINENERAVRWQYEQGRFKGVVFRLPGSKMLRARKPDLHLLYSPKMAALAAATSCPDKSPVVPWLLRKGLLVDTDNGYVFTEKANTLI